MKNYFMSEIEPLYSSPRVAYPRVKIIGPFSTMEINILASVARSLLVGNVKSTAKVSFPKQPTNLD
ncbi:hypothetical protein HZS_6156 [Henneguya salminicola]|nr:hypothetical protein HZS_6156 [Henneguya salminicola]